MKTITELEKELSHIRKGREKGKWELGDFGFKACKESIKFSLYIHKLEGLTIEKEYAELITRGLLEGGFNTNMIVACEELMRGE